MLRGLIAFAVAGSIAVASAHAGDIINPKSVIVFAYTDPDRPSVSASICLEADHVAIPLIIQGDHKDPAKRFEIIAQAKTAIISAAQAVKDIQVHLGPVALSSRPGSKFSSLGYGGTSQAELHVLTPLSGSGKDVFQCAALLSNFIGGVRLPKDAEIHPGPIRLAVDDPEQYREALLKNIAAEVSKARSALGPSAKVTISGLESPVFVRQADEKHVDLFLRHELVMTTDK